ncbi:hypothetical protein CHS0354_027845 [Potamilus streckersoni]|uniref:Cilia- and flagella-associated protein HOATZ n=1 Tax=Potamilus streckersoni TaxID=2493646 RepID=A0AAE0T1Q3_9BIVA|nr:hypothetical protein CHS0354_027845 [Potamilus streckersoni]
MSTVIDLTQQPEIVEFAGSSKEDINYATTFWQSIQLQPPMESRLVSSDIKQRLKVAPPSSLARNVAPSIPENSAVLQNFYVRAKTMEHFEEYNRVQKFAEARNEDKQMLMRRREERKLKEKISRNKGLKQQPDERVYSPDEYEAEAADTNDMDALKQIDDFEKKNIIDKMEDSDSD